jgi:Rrf2 family transcriptional regulator, iron-sulfur cluster assembly transcription factor
MPFLPRKGILAIAAVIDIAVHGRDRPVNAKALASRHHLPRRYLEPVLLALARQGILKGVRGQGGGYELAREPIGITAEDILRAVEAAEETAELPGKSNLLTRVVMPALAQAETVFSTALARIKVEDLVNAARGVNE